MLLFAASVVGTIAWCTSMSAMGDMTMPGGWTMSMAWMPMAGGNWLGAGASFLGMWTLMMVAMMLPSLTPALWRYREAIAAHGENRLATIAGLGYFFVWVGFGMAAFPVGAALAALEMHVAALARAVPVAIGVIVLSAGVLQLTPWKAHRLACCRGVSSRDGMKAFDAASAWRHGVRLGLQCVYCCANLMMILLAVGVMDLLTMIMIAAAITVERLDGDRAARAIGAIVIAAGLLQIARAAGLG